MAVVYAGVLTSQSGLGGSSNPGLMAEGREGGVAEVSKVLPDREAEKNLARLLDQNADISLLIVNTFKGLDSSWGLEKRDRKPNFIASLARRILQLSELSTDLLPQESERNLAKQPNLLALYKSLAHESYGSGPDLGRREAQVLSGVGKLFRSEPQSVASLAAVYDYVAAVKERAVNPVGSTPTKLSFLQEHVRTLVESNPTSKFNVLGPDCKAVAEFLSDLLQSKSRDVTELKVVAEEISKIGKGIFASYNLVSMVEAGEADGSLTRELAVALLEAGAVSSQDRTLAAATAGPSDGVTFVRRGRIVEAPSPTTESSPTGAVHPLVKLALELRRLMDPKLELHASSPKVEALTKAVKSIPALVHAGVEAEKIEKLLRGTATDNLLQSATGFFFDNLRWLHENKVEGVGRVVANAIEAWNLHTGKGCVEGFFNEAFIARELLEKRHWPVVSVSDRKLAPGHEFDCVVDLQPRKLGIEIKSTFGALIHKNDQGRNGVESPQSQLQRHAQAAMRCNVIPVLIVTEDFNLNDSLHRRAAEMIAVASRYAALNLAPSGIIPSTQLAESRIILMDRHTGNPIDLTYFHIQVEQDYSISNRRGAAA